MIFKLVSLRCPDSRDAAFYILCMRVFYLYCLLPVVFCSCRSSRVVSDSVSRDSMCDRRSDNVFINRSDTDVRHIVERDSIIVKDSVSVSERTVGDTVYISKEVWRWRERSASRTDNNTSRSDTDKEISSVREHAENREKKETVNKNVRKSWWMDIIPVLFSFLFVGLLIVAGRRFLS